MSNLKNTQEDSPLDFVASQSFSIDPGEYIKKVIADKRALAEQFNHLDAVLNGKLAACIQLAGMTPAQANKLIGEDYFDVENT